VKEIFLLRESMKEDFEIYKFYLSMKSIVALVSRNRIA
jgi:hypothetical protein